jgi:hypothetical protein
MYPVCENPLAAKPTASLLQVALGVGMCQAPRPANSGQWKDVLVGHMKTRYPDTYRLHTVSWCTAWAAGHVKYSNMEISNGP